MLIAWLSIAFWAFLTLVSHRRGLDYLILGFVLGFGLLSKYNFAAFASIMMVALLFDPNGRRAVLSPWMIVTLAMAGALVAPNLVYVAENRAIYEFYLTSKLGLDGSHADRVSEGLENVAVAILSFFVPFLFLMAVADWRSLNLRRASTPPAEPALVRLAGLTFPIALIVTVAGVAVLGVANVTERYMIAFLYPSFFWLMAKVQAADAVRARLAIWGGLLAATAMTILAVRFAVLAMATEPLCGTCSRWTPYDRLAESITQAGFSPEATYVTYNPDTAGNLRVSFPAATLRTLNINFYRPPPASDAAECVFVWSEDLAGAPLVERFAELGRSPETVMVTHDWEHPFKADWKTTRWGLTPIARDHWFYREWCA